MGLDQFRATNIVLDSAIEKRSPIGYVIARTTSGPVYIETGSSIYEVADGQSPRLLRSGIDIPQTVCEGSDGSIYFGAHNSMLRMKDGIFTPVNIVHPTVYYVDCARDATGALWYSVGTYGVMRFDGRNWTRFPRPKGHGNEWCDAIIRSGDQIITFINDVGLVRVNTQPERLLFSQHDVGIGQINVLLQRRDDLLIGGRFGLARARNGRLERLLSGAYPWLSDIRGIVQTNDGDIWMYGVRGLVRVRNAQLDAALKSSGHRSLPYMLFDMKDGLPGPPGENVGELVEGRDGRMWIASSEGVASIDLKHIALNELPPPVSITAVSPAAEESKSAIHRRRRRYAKSGN